MPDRRTFPDGPVTASHSHTAAAFSGPNCVGDRGMSRPTKADLNAGSPGENGIDSKKGNSAESTGPAIQLLQDYRIPQEPKWPTNQNK